MLPQYFSIPLNISHYLTLIFLPEPQYHLFLPYVQQIDILQCSRRFQVLLFNLPMHEAPFEVKHVHNVRIVRFLRISH